MARWDKKEELTMLREIHAGKSLESIAESHNRTVSAIELRLKKIVYENAIEGRSHKEIASLLGPTMTEDKIRQYFYSYKEFREKHTGLVDEDKQHNQHNEQHNQQHDQQHDQQHGGKENSDMTLEKINARLQKIETENKLLGLMIENKELTHKVHMLIKEGKIDKSIKEVIKKIRSLD